MNYIKIINWFWQEAPYMDGFKVQYGFLFFAILDSINCNRWAPWTRISYDNLINKCSIGNRMYLEGRQWLIDQNFIEMIPGKNAYQMVSFRLGVVVQKSTTIDTTIDINQAPLSAPQSAPIIKYKTNKQVKNKTLNINIPFEKFWNLYQKSSGKQKAELLWNKLTDEEREIAIQHIPAYVLSTPDKKFRKNPETYLRNKSFNDEIINSNEQPTGSYSAKKGNFKEQGFAVAKSELSDLYQMEGN